MYRDEDPDDNIRVATDIKDVQAKKPGWFRVIAYNCNRDITNCPERYTMINKHGNQDQESYQDSGVYPILTFYIPGGINPFNAKPTVHSSGYMSHMREGQLMK